ncbi:hypothetical protein MXB_2868 [Myxobolus squamalis]|nr:hypothetical protein MXB_2868 [Myxobolus squamalis]
MLPQGVFIGGIFSKYFPGESFVLEDKDILDRIAIILKNTLQSDRSNFYHFLQVGEEFKIFICNLSDLCVTETSNFKVLQTKNHDKSFSGLTSSLGKNFLDFNLNFELNFINRADTDSIDFLIILGPIEINFLQSFSVHI